MVRRPGAAAGGTRAAGVLRASSVALCSSRILSICIGAGGLDLGVRLALPDARTVCYVEREAFAVANLVAAMLGPALVLLEVQGDCL